MSIRLTGIVLTLLALFCWGCRKYVDGPYLSFSSKDKRIEGDWFVEQAVSRNLFDITATYAGFTFTFGKDSLVQILYPDTNGLEDTLGARWYLTGNKEVFNWLLDSHPEEFPFDSAAIFDISRLTNKEFWLYDSDYTLLKLRGFN